MKQKTGRKLLSFLLTLALVVGLMPGMGLTVYAAPAETLLTTITATGKTTYNQSVEGVVTVTLANIQSYDVEYGWLYTGTITVAPVEGYTITKCRFIQNNKTPLDDDFAPFSIVMKSPDSPLDGYCSVNTSTGQKGGRNMDGVTSIEVYDYANKTAQTITASDVTATYGDTDKSVSATTDGNGEISYAVKAGSEDYISVASDGKLTINKVPADGKAYVTVTASETNTGGTDGKGCAAATKDVTVNISKATVTITAKDQSIYVGGTVPTLSGADFYTVSGLVGEDALTTNPTLAYQNNGSAATPDNTTAGTYDIVASGASAGDNYNISYTKGALTISEKQPATVTKVPTAKTLTYNGSAQELVTAGTATGGEMQYALGTATKATEPYTTSIPTATDAGTYYVWYKVVGDENHSDTAPACVEVTISERPVYESEPSSLTVTSELGTITRVTVDGKAVDSKYYFVSGNSVVLFDEFMRSLANGEHTIRLYDGVTYATPTITAPKTADPGVAIYGLLAVSSTLGLAWMGKKRKAA